MTTITILPHPELCPEGAQLEAKPGETLCEVLLNHDIAIEHACEMSCACTTCHVVVREGFDTLDEPSEEEEDLLDAAWGLTATSRLSCQVTIGEDPLVIDIPKYTINHAREKSVTSSK